MSKEFLNPPTIHEPRSWTHVVKATGGTTIYVSGQLGVTLDGKALEGLEAQALQAYVNLRAALAAAGATPADVVKETIYIVAWDHDLARLQTLQQARKAMFGDRYPASTLVGVQALGRREYLIEVEAIAVLDGSAG